jgi:hypothetical protein
MQITLYQRTFPAPDSPVSVSFAPPDTAQRHTYTAGGKVYEAVFREVLVAVPDDAKLDVLKNLLCWAGDKGPTKSTAKEVMELARTKAPGFRAVKPS